MKCPICGMDGSLEQQGLKQGLARRWCRHELRDPVTHKKHVKHCYLGLFTKEGLPIPRTRGPQARRLISILRMKNPRARRHRLKKRRKEHKRKEAARLARAGRKK